MKAEPEEGRPLRGILDTSVLIRLGEIDEESLLPEMPLITAVTLAELSVGPLVAKNEEERALRQHQLQLAESSFQPLPFDAQAARRFGAVAASLRRSGRKGKARSLDAMIGAIALSRGLPLFTFNPGDFEGMEGLEVIPL